MSGKPYFAVIDFEATCWEDERRADQEVIECGCVTMERESGKLIGEFSTFIRPVRYPTLSDYCSALTGISQRDVDTAPTFPYALGMLVDWLEDPLQYSFCAWGEFDRFILRAACRFHRVPFPFDDEFVDIKPVFIENVAGRSVPLQRALDMLGLEHEGRLHRAVDDARNTARIWGELIRGIL